MCKESELSCEGRGKCAHFLLTDMEGVHAEEGMVALGQRTSMQVEMDLLHEVMSDVEVPLYWCQHKSCDK